MMSIVNSSRNFGPVSSSWADYRNPPSFRATQRLHERLGSAPKALRVLLAQGREEMFAQARASRRSDLLVYLASANLRKKMPFTQLPESVRVDIRTLFGSYEKGL